MFLLNSRPAFFSAPPVNSASKWLRLPGGPFSRSYRALLSSSLAEVISSALGLLSQPTSGGLRYGRLYSITTKLFLSAWVRQNLVARRLPFPPPSARSAGVDLPAPAWPSGDDVNPITRSAYPPAPLLGFKRNKGGAGILTCYPSPSASAYGLGPTNPTPMNVA